MPCCASSAYAWRAARGGRSCRCSGTGAGCACAGCGTASAPSETCPPADLIRIDTCWSIANGLGLVDNVRGADFHARHFLLALKAGEPSRIARALAMETAHSAPPGCPRRSAPAAWPGRRARWPSGSATTSRWAGRRRWPAWPRSWKAAGGAALHESDHAARIFRERCPGATHELATAQSYSLLALLYLGDLGEMARRLPPLLQDADERGDVFAALRLRTRPLPVARLAAGEPERASREVQRALAGWSYQGFSVQHYSARWARASIRLYAGQPLAAANELDATADVARRSLTAARAVPAHRGPPAACARDPGRGGRRPGRSRAAAHGRSAGRADPARGDTLGRRAGALLEAGLLATRGDRAGALALWTSRGGLPCGADRPVRGGGAAASRRAARWTGRAGARRSRGRLDAAARHPEPGADGGPPRARTLDLTPGELRTSRRRAELKRFSQVLRPDAVGAGQVGDRQRDLEHPVV